MTLYGLVLSFHLADVKDSFLAEATNLSRTALTSFFDREGKSDPELKPILLVFVCVVSNDLRHNPAFIQHVNDKMVLPWVQSDVMCEKPLIHYARSDGAPTQFDNATQ